MYRFTAPKNLSPFHFTSLSINYHINPSLHFTLLFISTPHFPSLPLTGFRFPNIRFENIRFAVASLYRPFQSVMVLFTKQCFPTYSRYDIRVASEVQC